MNDLAILQPFLQETHTPNPTSDEVSKYLSSRRLSRTNSQILRNWQARQEHGDIETEHCPTCWAIAVIEPGSYQDGIAFSTCDSCYCTVCEFCHRHNRGEGFDHCLCSNCAEQSRLDAAIPA